MRRLVLAVITSAATLAVSLPAWGQQGAQNDYVEQKVASGQAVIFKDDPLKAGGLDPNGYIIRTRGSFWKTGLLRPRLNFVPEMLKSAEAL